MSLWVGQGPICLPRVVAVNQIIGMRNKISDPVVLQRRVASVAEAVPQRRVASISQRSDVVRMLSPYSLFNTTRIGSDLRDAVVNSGKGRELQVESKSDAELKLVDLSILAENMTSRTPPRFMIVSDLDNTMVDHHDKDNSSLLRFGALWEAGYRHDSLLVFSTGRSPVLYQELRNQVPLLTPDIAITSVGTEIVYGDTMEADLGWTQELDQGWDRNAILEEATNLALTPQRESEQRPHKLSFLVEKAKAEKLVADLSEKLKARGVIAKLIYSGGQDLDVLPQGAGKGQALAYLLKKFKNEKRLPVNTLVCGDSGNDAELFAVPDVHGVMVGNAMEELLEWHEKNAKDNSCIFRATERCAAGIIQAMQHFNFVPNVSARDLSVEELLTTHKTFEDETTRVSQQVIECELYFEKWLRGEIENTDDNFGRLKKILDERCYIVHAQGKVENFYKSMDEARSLHGALPHFRLWVDRLYIRNLADGVWDVRFDKWQTTAEERSCRITSSVLLSQEGAPNGLKWMNLHETYLDGHSVKPIG